MRGKKRIGILKEVEKNFSEGLSIKQTAKRMNIPTSTISNIARKHNLSRVDGRSIRPRGLTGFKITKKWLEDKLSKGNVTVQDLAGELTCAESTIYKFMRQHNLSTALLTRKQKDRVLEQRELAKEGLKTCPQCDTIKSNTEFYANKSTWDGFHSCCIPCRNILKKEEYRELKPKLLEYQAKFTEKQRKEKTKALNKFYQENDVPEHLWYKGEFAAEKDFQNAVAHVISNRFGLNVELEKHFDRESKVDIYIDEIKLIVEVKLEAATITDRRRVEDQVSRYKKHEETVVVSLDGKLDGWDNCQWFSPEQLFDFISNKK